MSIKTVVAVAVICAAGAFFAGRHLVPDTSDLDSPSENAAAAKAEQPPELGAEAQMRLNAERDLAAEREKTAQLTAEVAALKEKYENPEAPQAGDVTQDPLALHVKGKPRYAYAAVGDALDDKDWPKFGEAVAHLLPLIVSLKKAILDEAPMPENVGDIQRWNGELVNLAVGLDRADLPGTGTNGAFTHPAVMVNLVHAALREAGQPLSEKQEDRLREIGDRYTTDEARRAASYGEDVFQLQKTIEETALKDRFFAEVDAMLSQAQRDVLHPADVKGRMGIDIFSSGVIWYVVSRPVLFTSRADLADALLKQVRSLPAYEERFADLFQDAAREWANGFSGEYLDATDDRLARASSDMNAGLLAGWASVQQAHVAAKHQLALNQALVSRLPRDAEIVKILRESPRVMMPLKRPAPAEGG